jgi:hypothetical protein
MLSACTMTHASDGLADNIPENIAAKTDDKQFSAVNNSVSSIPAPATPTVVKSGGKTVSQSDSSIDKSQAKECPVGNVVCTMDYSPVVCSAATYDGIMQPLSSRLMAWGSNGCSGRLKLHKEACLNHLLPSKLGSIQCVPDASNGHCPTEDVACSQDVVPSECRAASYASAVLDASQQITGRGDNECRAKADLRRQACRANLDPQQLDKISCHPVSSKKGQ